MRGAWWIWFVGCAVWTADAALQMHYGAALHARFAFMLAMLFFAAGIFYRNQRDR